IYNIGGGEENIISLLECIKLIEDILGKKVDYAFEPERFGDLKYFVCDSRKAEKYLNWKSKIKPREGVEKLIAWIKNNHGLFRS
ncbi:MAG: nucleoside-diphosphate sugar epimerase, partial [Elusimicrobia bacterium]|nr:nucleoside-diphosphate sugar epimerase [Elusimicrobiota bacterium]